MLEFLFYACNAYLVYMSNLRFLNFSVTSSHDEWVGPCHHSMTRPQVVDGGTVSDMESSCEYIE